MINILLNGSNVNMVKAFSNYIKNSNLYNLEYAIDKQNCYLFNEILDKPDVIIDFSTPISTFISLNYAVENLVPIVIATTGFSADDENAYEQTSIEINGETHLFDLGKRTKDLNAELSMIYLTMYGPYDIVQEHDYAGKGDLYMELESVALTTAEKAKADSLANTTAGTFNDQFTADSVDFYDPTPYKDMYNNDVSKDLAYNMVVEDGVAKLYGGGQFIQFDNLSSTSSEYVPEYDLASASSYTVKFSGKLEGIDNSEISMGKFGFTVGVVFNEDNVSDNTAWGGIFFAPKENSNNLEASGFIYTADDDTPIEVSNDSAFDITVEISKNDDGNWQSVTTGTIGNQDINFINSSTSQTNPVAVFFSPWGPYETGWAGKGPLYATLESFSFSCK